MEIKGIVCAMVTPLNPHEDIDLEATDRLTKHVVQGGADAILALGSTGEQIALDRNAKRTFLAQVKASLPQKIPLIAGCGATSTRLAIENVEDAQKAQADAVILTPPCFYPFDDDGMVRYFTEVANAAQVPVFLYNISRYVGSKIGVEAVRRLMEHPAIQGIKESDRDEAYLQQLLAIARESRPDFTVIQGSERIFLKSFQWGCKAGVTVVGNLYPSIAPALWQAWCQKNILRAEALQQQLLDCVALITMLGRFPAELKQCLQIKGLCSARMTSPFQELTARQIEELSRALKQLEEKYMWGKEA